MDAPTLRSIFDAIYLLSVSAWLGSLLFFSFGVAPVVFRVLEAPAAARFVRALFPRYYAWGATCGAVALPALLGTPLSYPEYRGPAVAVQAGVLLVCTLVMLYGGNALTPAVNAAHDAGPEGQAWLDRLHRRSVRLNALVIFGLAALLVAFAGRPAPTTAGIVEPSPRERAAREFEAYRQREAAYLESLQPRSETSAPGAAVPRPRIPDPE